MTDVDVKVRSDGFYWVNQHGDKWTIAEWRGTSAPKGWVGILGDTEYNRDDNDFVEIGNRVLRNQIGADEIFKAIEHGDQEHRDWLREALDAIFTGNPVPPPRGKGTGNYTRKD